MLRDRVQRNVRTLLRAGGIGVSFADGTRPLERAVFSTIVVAIGCFLGRPGQLLAAIIVAMIWAPLVLSFLSLRRREAAYSRGYRRQ